MEFYVALEKFLDGNCLGRAVLRAPTAGTAVVLYDSNLAVNLVGDNFTLDGDALLGADFHAHFAGVALGLVPDHIALDFSGLGSKFLVLDPDGRTECTTQAAQGAFFLVDREGGLGFKCCLSVLCACNRSLVGSFIGRDIPVDCITRADLFADRCT